MATEKTSSKGQAWWFCTTGLPSDIVIEVDDMTFHLHKFPLMSKSRKLHDLITEQESTINPAKRQTTNREDDDDDEVKEEEEEEESEAGEYCHVTLTDFPGGCETFETAAKFCYGVKIELSPLNVAPLRCAGEFLGMTEEYSEENLISKTERFLTQSVLKSLKDSILTLKTCEKLMPVAETLGIVQRCIESVSNKASSSDPSLFGWPVSDEMAAKLSNQGIWNGIETGLRRKSSKNSWFEDLALLSLPLFKRLIMAMRAQDLSPEIIENCLIYYAKKYIPGISRSSRKPSSSSFVSSETEQKELIETIISNLPMEKTTSRSFNSRSSTATRFLFGLLRTANILNASDACRGALERKIGSQLENANLDDLLIPSYSYLNETLYDVDCLERILSYFLDRYEEERSNAAAGARDDENNEGHARSPAIMLVGKLIDGYLSEIASDANLKPEKFYNLAVSLPDEARLFDDGLYRAVDVYLKAHPWIAEEEREKICGIMDCQKLTLEACTHAAQNERLPLRAVVQVLFFEQLQLRQAIAGSILAAEVPMVQPDLGRPSDVRGQGEAEVEEEEEEEEEGQVQNDVVLARQPARTWTAAMRENQVLRLDLDSMRSRVHVLERECSTMRKAIQKIDKSGSQGGGGGWRTSLTKRFGCKFKTQVCDSHEATAVDAGRARHRHQHQHQHQH
ncbi:NPH3 domain [Dillenia turbinata]|uniref:NPH3 domain n=1 Tax=Dillenia turbinata TaxID=194707 RepID=A0AAN8Z4B7_9MAGN